MSDKFLQAWAAIATSNTTPIVRVERRALARLVDRTIEAEQDADQLAEAISNFAVTISHRPDPMVVVVHRDAFAAMLTAMDAHAERRS